eukprot:scaffold459_cov117-Isochrysis_galbana.AAC.26
MKRSDRSKARRLLSELGSRLEFELRRRVGGAPRSGGSERSCNSPPPVAPDGSGFGASLPSGAGSCD